MFDISSLLGLDKLNKVFSVFERLPIQIFPERCCRRRQDAASCQECLKVCQVEAVDLNDGVEIDFDKCNACGLCATVCPTGVFYPKPSDLYFLAQIKKVLNETNRSSVYFYCRDQDELIDGIKVNCLGRLNEALLVGAAVLGAENIFLSKKGCSSCETKSGEPVTSDVVSVAKKLLSSFGSTAEIIYDYDVPWEFDSISSLVEFDTIDRRDFLTNARTQALAVGSEFLSDTLSKFLSPSEEIGFKYNVPEKRKLLLTFLRKMAGPIREEHLIGAELPFVQVDINDECFYCKQCVLFCPTEALSTIDENEKITVTFSLPNCTKCNLCKEVCPVGAVSFSEKIALKKLLTDKPENLITLSQYVCKSCRQKFGSVGVNEKCGFCIQKEAKLGDDAWY